MMPFLKLISAMNTKPTEPEELSDDSKELDPAASRRALESLQADEFKLGSPETAIFHRVESSIIEQKPEDDAES